MRKYEELVKDAMAMLEDNADLFVDMVNELDSWDGFADGFRCYGMYELDDLFCDCKVSEFLEKVDVDNFNLADEYFADTIYGLRSVDDIYVYYCDNTCVEDVYDAIIENYNHLYFSDKDFEELIEEIVNYSEDDDEDGEN